MWPEILGPDLEINIKEGKVMWKTVLMTNFSLKKFVTEVGKNKPSNLSLPWEIFGISIHSLVYALRFYTFTSNIPYFECAKNKSWWVLSYEKICAFICLKENL